MTLRKPGHHVHSQTGDRISSDPPPGAHAGYCTNGPIAAYAQIGCVVNRTKLQVIFKHDDMPHLCCHHVRAVLDTRG